MNKLVSVIIPTTDKEVEETERCVNSICMSSYKNTETIVVNEGKERSEQRNIGLDRAKGEYVMYLDSDQYVSPNLIGECVNLIDNGWVSLYIPEIVTTPSWFGRLRNYERSFYNSTPVDCVRFIKADCCPRFDVTLNGPEDSDFDRRIRGARTITRNPLYHNDGETLLSYIRKKSYYSKSMGRYHDLHPDDKVLSTRYRCFDIFIENEKWKKIVRHPIAFAMVVFLIFIRGLIYLKNKEAK